MPGPSIANATVTVDLDGRRIPAEAAVLGREAGAAMGKAHSDAFEGELEQGLSKVGRNLAKDMRDNGKESGGIYGRSFGDAMRNEIRSHAADMQRDIARIFTSSDGFDEFHRALNGVDVEMGQVDRTAQALRGRLEELNRTGGIGSKEFKDGITALQNWAKAARPVEEENVRIRDSLRSLREEGLNRLLDGMADSQDQMAKFRNEMEDVHGAALALNDEFDRTSAAKFADDWYKDASGAHAYLNEIAQIRKEQEELDRFMRTSDATIADFGRELLAVGGAAQQLPGRFAEFRAAVGRAFTEGNELLGRFAFRLNDLLEPVGKFTDALSATVNGKLREFRDGISSLALQARELAAAFTAAAIGKIREFGDTLKGLAVQARDAATALGAQIAARARLLGDAMQLLALRARSVGEAFGVQVTSRLRAFGDTVAALPQRLETLRGDLLTVWRDLPYTIDRARDAVDRFGIRLQDVGTNLRGEFLAVWRDLPFTIAAAKSSIESFAGTVKSSLVGAWQKLPSMIGAVRAEMNRFSDDVKGRLVSAWRDVPFTVNQAVLAIERFSASTEAKITPAVKAISAAVRDVTARFRDIVGVIDRASGQTLNTVRKFMADLPGLIESGTRRAIVALRDFPATFTTITHAVDGFAVAAGPKLKAAFNSVADAVRSFPATFTTLTHTVDDLAVGLGSRLKTALSNLLTAMGPAGGALRNIGSATEAALGKFKTFSDTLTRSIGPAVERFIGSIRNFPATFTTISHAVDGFASSVGKTLLGEFRNFPATFTAITHAVDGVAVSVGGRLKGAFSSARAEVKPFATAIGDVVRSGLGILGKLVDDGVNGLFRLGSAADKAGGKMFSLKGILSAFKGFDPFDNFGSAVILIIGLLTPLTVLVSSLTAGVLVLGTALGSTLIGLVAFYGILRDITKLDASGLKALPTQMRDTAKAFQDLIGTYNKTKFVPGKLFTELGKGLADTFLKTKGLDEALRSFTDKTLPAINGALQPVAAAVGNLMKQFLTDLSSKNALSTIHTLLKQVADELPTIGKIASNVFGIIGQLFIDASGSTKNFLGSLSALTGKWLEFLRSPEGHHEVQTWMKGAMDVLGTLGGVIGTTVKALAGLVTPQGLSQTKSDLKSLGEAVPGIVKLGDALSQLLPPLLGFIATMSKVFAPFMAVLDSALTGVQAFYIGTYTFFSRLVAVIDAAISSVVGTLGKFGTVMHDLFTGQFDKLAGDTKAAFDSIAQGGKNFANSMGAAFGDATATWNTYDAKTKSALTSIATNLDIPKGKAREFELQVAKLAEAGGVSLASLKNDTSLQQLADHLGITLSAAKVFFGEWIDGAGRVKGSASTMAADLMASATKLTGSTKAASDYIATLKKVPSEVKTAIVEDAIAHHKNLNDYSAIIKALPKSWQTKILEDAAAHHGNISGYGALIKALPKSTQLKVLEDATQHGHNLSAYHTIISQLPKSQQLKLIEDAAAHGTNLKGYKSIIQGLPKSQQLKLLEDAAAHGRNVSAYKSIIGGVYKTWHTQFSSNASAQAAAAHSLRDAINSIPGYKKVYIETIEHRMTDPRYKSAIGGVTSPWGQLAGGRAYATGGIVDTPTQLNPFTLAGEAGPEAIVPLSGPLAAVDASVRQLAAYARGVSPEQQGTGPQKIINIQSGAVQVITPAQDPETVAGMVVDRMVPQL